MQNVDCLEVSDFGFKMVKRQHHAIRTRCRGSKM